jgi:hypothetical protein
MRDAWEEVVPDEETHEDEVVDDALQFKPRGDVGQGRTGTGLLGGDGGTGVGGIHIHFQPAEVLVQHLPQQRNFQQLKVLWHMAKTSRWCKV